MLTLPPLPAHDTASDAWARDILVEQVEMLGRLARVGMKIAEAIGAQTETVVEGQTPAEASTDAARAYASYARVARAVRLTLMLQERVIGRLRDLDHEAAGQRLDQARDRKASLERIVKRVAADQGKSDTEAVLLGWNAKERLDREDLYGDVLEQPVSELIAVICRDLGLEPDWPRLATEAWAQDEMAAAGSLFKASPIGEDHRPTVLSVASRSRPPPEPWRPPPG